MFRCLHATWPVHAGRPMEASSSTSLARHGRHGGEQRHFDRLDRHGSGRDWVLSRRPKAARHRRRRRARSPAQSTLRVAVTFPGGGTDVWDEVESWATATITGAGPPFHGRDRRAPAQRLRFGNGTNGQLLPHAVVRARTRSARRGRQHRRRSAGVPQPLTGVWRRGRARVEPIRWTDGRDPETAEKAAATRPRPIARASCARSPWPTTCGAPRRSRNLARGARYA